MSFSVCCLKVLANDLKHSLILTLSSLNPRLYIFRSLLIHLDQACANRSLLQVAEIFVLSKGPS